MANAATVTARLQAGVYDSALRALYGEDAAAQRARCIAAVQAFACSYPHAAERDIGVYSAPGRTELCGNHTDHQNGVVLAAAVRADIMAVVARCEEAEIHLRSAGFDEAVCVQLNRLQPQTADMGTTAALVRGVAEGLQQRGAQLGGFYAYLHANVPVGSGLSSSAAVEMCLASILNGEYNGGALSPFVCAQAGQYAENVHFGKASGMMDQLASALGGVQLLDLQDPAQPTAHTLELDTARAGLQLMSVNTRESHAGLDGEYSAIRTEMESVARFFGQKVLRQVPQAQFWQQLAAVRAAVGDRAVLRAVHFFEECGRVHACADALRQNDMAALCHVLNEAGRSSCMYNQNAAVPQNPRQQGMVVALAVAEKVLAGTGACRLQGGGFGGTVLALVPQARQAAFCTQMESVFGIGACQVLHIRRQGACCLL